MPTISIFHKDFEGGMNLYISVYESQKTGKEVTLV